MHCVAPLISNLRLSRFHRWAMLWLDWLAGFLDQAGANGPISAQAKAIAHRWLDTIEWLIVSIVLIRVAQRLHRLPCRRGPRRPMRAGFRRAFMGAHIRRALRRKDLRQRIAALRSDLDVIVAQTLKRLPHGLLRRRPLIPAPCAHAPALSDPRIAPAPAFDSS